MTRSKLQEVDIKFMEEELGMKQSLPKLALGAWSWGSGTAGGDQVFGNHLEEKDLKPIFDAAMEKGLNLWDTATVYGMGASEDILGSFVKDAKREDVIISTKFTPQIASMYEDSMEKMADASMKRLGTNSIDIYWIHNPADVERWTPELAPLLRSGKVKAVGVSNHNRYCRDWDTSLRRCRIISVCSTVPRKAPAY